VSQLTMARQTGWTSRHYMHLIDIHLDVKLAHLSPVSIFSSPRKFSFFYYWLVNLFTNKSICIIIDEITTVFTIDMKPR